MVSTFSPSLRIELPATGDQSGTWGVTTNTNLGTLIEAAIAGGGSDPIVHGDTPDYTLSVSDGAADEARRMILRVEGTLTADRNVVCPSVSKVYILDNRTTGGFSVTLKTAGGTGVAVAAGAARLLYCDGTNVVDAQSALQQAVDNLSTNALLRNGSVVAAANLPMGGFVHTGVGNATARDQYPSAAQIQDGSLTFIPPADVGGTADAITLAPSPAITAYAAGQTFVFEVEADNTAAVTVDVSGVGPVNLVKDADTALAPGDLKAGFLAVVMNDGTRFHLVSAAGAARVSSSNTFIGDQNVQLSDDAATAGPSLSIVRRSASPAADDDLGLLSFDGDVTGGGVVSYGNVRGTIVNPAAGAADGRIRYRTIRSGSFGDRFNIGAGVWVGDAIEGDMGLDSANIPRPFGNGAFLLPGFKAGLTVTRTGARTLSIGAGSIADSLDQEMLPARTLVNLDLNVGGDFVNGAALAADTWYHLLVGREGSVYRRGFSQTVAKPAAWDSFRRVTSILTDSSSDIVPFVNVGNRFVWGLPFNDLSTTPSSIGQAVSLTVPPDVRVLAQVALLWDHTSNGRFFCRLRPLDVTDAVVTSANTNVVLRVFSDTAAGAGDVAANMDILTDTARQIGARTSSAVGSFNLNTFGWEELYQ